MWFVNLAIYFNFLLPLPKESSNHNHHVNQVHHFHHLNQIQENKNKCLYLENKSLYLNKTIANLFATLGSGLIAFGIESLFNLGQALKGIKSIKQLMFFLSIVGIIGIAIFGRYTLKTFRLYFKYRDISKWPNFEEGCWDKKVQIQK